MFTRFSPVIFKILKNVFDLMVIFLISDFELMNRSLLITIVFTSRGDF
ncbi:hypothetical protein STRIC_0926 [Streptococcus ictaluri 707-05]|uniref:Uncharacterized protein n=1 Tax=Streptococcus ictaluri 707-05 TaxID=764299 RepID=G5K060_9STRE|nr:hypothetical protein STRIC_0926 [Streptococcus ictaluri 707-05]